MKKQVFNPILPGWEYIPDGEPHVFGDRVYIYGSHDRFDGDNYCLNNYVCWSAPVSDLSDWQFHGEIFDLNTDPLNEDGKYCGYAPDCCQGPDGRYYLYYALNNHLAMSVAVCDTPAGKYEFLGHMKTQDGRIWGTEEGDAYVFDPAVLVDDDGRIHLYMGFSPTDGMKGSDFSKFLERWNTDGCHHVELCSDMVTMKTEPLLVIPGCAVVKGTGFEGHAIFEAPSIRKFFGKYYFVYSSQHCHELCYAIADSPTGPFEFKGCLVSNIDLPMDDEWYPKNHFGNNHGGMVEINGKFYVFYHRQTNNTGYSRQACAEELVRFGEYEFIQSEITSCGLNGKPLCAAGEYNAGIACNLYSLIEEGQMPYITQREPDSSEENTQYIKNIKDKAVIGFKFFNFKGGEKISVVAKADKECYFDVFTNLNAEPVAKIYLSEACSLSRFDGVGEISAGVHPIYFVASCPADAEIELESIVIS